MLFSYVWFRPVRRTLLVLLPCLLLVLSVLVAAAHPTPGALDLTFQEPPESSTDPYGSVQALALQPDGKIVIGGNFTSVSGVGRNRIARLNTDGSLDPAFAPAGGADDWVLALALQPDGKVVIGGDFVMVNGVSRSYIARLSNMNPLPRLFLSPAATTFGRDRAFQLDLQCDTANRVADTVQAYLTYDPAVLDVVDATGNPATSITPNPAVVDHVTENQVDPATGKIRFSAAKSTSPYLAGTATVATIASVRKCRRPAPQFNLCGVTPRRAISCGTARRFRQRSARPPFASWTISPTSRCRAASGR